MECSNNMYHAETYSKPSRTSKIEPLGKIVTIFAKSSISDVLLDFKYVSAMYFKGIYA